MKKIALIAHDNMKNDLVEFTKKHVDFFKKYPLVATGTTGKRIAEATGLEIHRYQSGPIGGDQQIGADIAMNEMEAVFFLEIHLLLNLMNQIFQLLSDLLMYIKYLLQLINQQLNY